MPNVISSQFNNQISSLDELRDYLTQRIEHIKKVDGKLTKTARELQDILDMLPEEE